MSFLGRIFGLERNAEYELGIRYFNEANYKSAIEQFEKVIKGSSRNDPIYALGMFYAAESHAHIGAAKFHADDLEGALFHFSKALEENPTYPDLYYRMGVIHHRLGNQGEAEGMLRRAVELNSTYFEAICYLGIVHFEKGEKEEADALFKAALDIGAESPSPISKFLSSHLDGRETDIPPLSSLKEIMLTDSDFDSLVKEGIEAFNTGNFESAVQCFENAALIHPDYADVRFKLGLSHLRKGANEEARNELKKALSINPNYTEARFYLGITYLDQKMYSEALVHFEGAVEDKPDYADLQCFLGATCFYLGDLERAKKVLQRSLKLSPNYRKAHYYYGLLLYTMGEKEEAIEYLTRAMKGGDEMHNASISLALVHLREGNLEEAMAVLKEILEAGGESADILYFIGDVYLRMGRMDQAEVFIRKSLEGNPDFLRAKEKLALILMKRGDYQGAERVLDTPDDNFADLYKIMGDIKFYRGDLSAAEDFYRKSLDVNAEYSEASLSLALTLRKRGSGEEADKILHKLLELDPENVVARNLLGRGPLDLESI